jgi:Tfp pilus assembly protein PilF
MRSGRGIGALAAAILVVACGCASSPSASKQASAQLKFGTRVARLGYWQEARFRFEHAVAFDPGNARAHNNLAVALEAVAEFGAAFDEYKKAVSLDAKDRPIQQNYTRFAEFYSAYTKRVGKVSPAP